MALSIAIRYLISVIMKKLNSYKNVHMDAPL